MAITTPADPRWASNTGNSYYTVDPGTAADNIFVFANGSEKIRYVPDGPYRALATAYGGGDVTSRLQAVLDHASVKEVLVDTQAFTISGTLTIPTGKVLSFAKGGSLAGSGTPVGTVRADYDQNIFAQTLDTTNISSATGKVSLEWWTPAGDGTTSDQTAITKAFGTLTKHIIVGQTGADKTYYIANSGTYNGFPLGTKCEFLPGAKFRTGTANVNFFSQIIAGDDQQIFAVNDANDRIVSINGSNRRYVSVKWCGAVGDNATDDTAAIQVAHNWACNRYSGSANSRCDTYFPPGRYRCDNIQLLHNVIGSGEFSTVQAYTAGEYAFICSQNVQSLDTGAFVWSYIRNISILGGFESNGITYGNLGVDDQDVGKWTFDMVNFSDCVRHIYKPAGNIGNYFTSCTFTSGEYHYFAVENPDPVMHTGCDYFINCHFRGASKASIYIDQTANGGNHVFLACIFEYNPGFAIFATYGNALFPLSVTDCYMEGNGTGGTINIEGTDYAAQNYYFDSAKAVNLTRTAVKTMTLANASVVRVNECNMYIDDAVVTKDSASMVTYDQMFGFTIDNDDVMCLTPPICDPDSSANAKFNIGIPKAVKSPENGFLISRSLHALQPQGGGQPAYNATGIAPVTDGILYPTCLEVASGTGNIQVCSSFTVPPSKFAVINIGIKKVSGTVPAQVDFVNSLTTNFITDSTDWKYFTKISYTGAGSSSYALAQRADVTYRISCLQVHAFDTYEQAYNFCLVNQFASYDLNYDLSVGKKGGRTLTGGTDSGDGLTFSTTSYTTKGIFRFGTSVESLRIHETTGNVSIGQNITNILAWASAYRVLTIIDTSNGGTNASSIIEMATSQRDSTDADDATKPCGQIVFINNASGVTNKHAGTILIRMDGATNLNRGGRFEVWLKPNGSASPLEVFAIDNTGKVYVKNTPTTAAAGQYPLYRNNTTGEITQGATVAAVDSIDKFTITGTSSRTVATGQTIYEIHLKSNASITVNIGTSAGGTDIGTHSLVSGVTVIQPFIQTADSTVTIHFTYTSGTGNIDVIHVKKIY